MSGKQHRRNAKKQALFASIEESLRAALRGEVEPVEEAPAEEYVPTLRRTVHKRTRAQPLHQHKTTLTYSVRHHWGGQRFVVSYSADTISVLVVEGMASRDIQAKKYIDVVHLDTIRV